MAKSSRLLLLAALLLIACARDDAGVVDESVIADPAPGAVQLADATINFDAAATGAAVNPLILGSNVEWVWGGDNLLLPKTLTFDSAMLSMVHTMHPTALRYPGGDQSDVYDFTRGLGPLAARGSNLMAPTSTTQITYMGSAELLELAQYLGATPLFTVNAVTGDAADAAAWVRLTNVTGMTSPAGKHLPKVHYWEIGNEPYLPSPDGSRPQVCHLDPQTYASRINAFTAAMRAVDPTIKIGIALANDTQNGIAVVSPGCRGFANTVLAHLTQSVDFISLHDAYLPYDPTGRDHAAQDEFLAAMASAQTVHADFTAMRTLLSHYAQFRSLPFALTEYNASFSLNPASRFVHSMASPVGALLVADLLIMLAAREDVLMAELWSLSANDHWGAIHAATATGGPYGRPTYEVFRLLGETLQGRRLPTAVQAPGFNAPSLGFSAAARGLPVLTTLLTRSTATGTAPVLHLLIINKDFSARHSVAIRVSNGVVASVHETALTASDVFADQDVPGSFLRTESDPPISSLSSLSLPPHGITLLTLQLTP